MKNRIKPFNDTPRRKEIVEGLLYRMDADIVAPGMTLPDVAVERVGRLMSGGIIDLSVPDSENCFLETDSEFVSYTEDNFGRYIQFRDQADNPKKHAMKERVYSFGISLAGQRSRNR